MIYELRHYSFEPALDAFTITCLLESDYADLRIRLREMRPSI
jgi:hypothetical protein